MQGSDQQAQVTASRLLRDAREQRGMSQKEVADELYLSTSFIKYIDADTLEKIPKAAFIKGYLRSYARVVGVDPQQVVGLYEESQKQDAPELRDVTEETVGSSKFTGPVLQTGLVGLFGIVVVVAMVWWIASSSDEEHTVATPVSNIEDAIDEALLEEQTVDSAAPDFDYVLAKKEAASAQSAEDPAVEDAKVEAAADESAIERTAAQPIQTKPELVQAEVEPTVQADILAGQNETSGEEVVETASSFPSKQVNIQRSHDGNTNYITLDAGGFDQIEATFTDECWLEVEDGDGLPIYGDLNKKGDVLRIYGVAPFKLLVGKTDTVTLLYNGEEIDLSRYHGNQGTAKLTLGN